MLWHDAPVHTAAVMADWTGALADPGDPAPALVAVFFLFPKITTELADLILTQNTSKESRRGLASRQ
jgi:hypothetical protein